MGFTYPEGASMCRFYQISNGGGETNIIGDLIKGTIQFWNREVAEMNHRDSLLCLFAIFVSFIVCLMVQRCHRVFPFFALFVFVNVSHISICYLERSI